MCGRLGGDEFLIVISHVSATNIEVAINRFRELFGSLSFPFAGQSVKISATFGIAGCESGKIRISTAGSQSRRNTLRSETRWQEPRFVTKMIERDRIVLPSLQKALHEMVWPCAFFTALRSKVILPAPVRSDRLFLGGLDGSERAAKLSEIPVGSIKEVQVAERRWRWQT
jgi:hypothetical protein